MICNACGKTHYRSYMGMCQGCYNYFRQGGKIYPLPERGTIARDENGKVICHICGRSYARLGSHVRESHGMTISQYKEIFGLCNSAKTTEISYSKKMSELAYRNGMDKQVLKIGEATRIKKGESDKRKNKEVRLQELYLLKQKREMRGKKK